MNYKKILKKINQLSEKYKSMSDLSIQVLSASLREKNVEFNSYKMVAEVFALVREADKRVLGLYPTDEQVLGALALYYGNIAEMKTGEGKSLVATMPLFLKSIEMGTVFLVTTNDYLAKRDFERIGPVYEWLGLKVSDGSNDPGEKDFDHERRREIYSSDIVYLSNSTLGFDYLIDGLAESKKEQFIPPLNYALLDEVDEILLDSAQMPLIISGAPKVQSNYFMIANQFVLILNHEIDFKLDEEHKNVWLTEQGIERAKKYFSEEQLLGKKFFTLYQHLILALKAHHIFKKTKDYLIEDGEIKLLDSKDGRILEGTKLQSGLHQAIEAKEGVKLTPESQTVSSITFQNLFRKFRQLSGMSGTAKVAENEFINTYNLPVEKIPTHQKNIRCDHKTEYYVTFEAKLEAALAQIKALHKQGRPILIITGSVNASELFSMHLFNLGIPHNILNAKSSSKEAQIIKEAGQVGSVTVSTTMAGRGTDIAIEEDAIKNGGLAVLITESMLNKRIEMQAKGRAGRQGEPGDTFSYESLEDELIKHFMQDSVQGYYNRHHDSQKKIKNLRVKNSFKRAQKISEERSYEERINALQFDEVLRIQKEMINRSREKIIALSSFHEAYEIIQAHALLLLNKFFSQNVEHDELKLQRFILDNIDYNFKRYWLKDSLNTVEEEKQYILGLLKLNLERKQEQLHDESVFLQYLQISILKAIDLSWSSQVNSLNQLRSVVQSRSTAQKKPLIEFEKEAKKSYYNRKNELAQLMIRNVALSLFEIKKGELIVTFP